MPLIIPPPSTAMRDSFTAYMLELQDSRIRREERKRAEEAADAGSAGLGGMIGTIAGIALALPTGGASLAAALPAMAVTGMIGGGLGTITGSLIDPPGSAVPGGQGAQLARGTGQLVQGIGQLGQIKAEKVKEGRKGEASLLESVGLLVSNLEDYLKTPEAAGLTRAEATQNLVQQTRQRLVAQEIDRTRTATKAKIRDVTDEEKKQAVEANPGDYEFNESQQTNLKELEAERTRLLQARTKLNFGDPRNRDIAAIADLDSQLSEVRALKENIFLDVKKRPTGPMTFAQQVATRRPLETNVPYPITDDPQTSPGFFMRSERGPIKYYSNPRGQDGSSALFSIEGLPGRYKKNEEGADVPVTMQDFKGGQVALGTPVEHPTQGSGRWKLEEKGGVTYADFVPYDKVRQKETGGDDSIISDMAETLLKQSSASVDSVLMDMLSPLKDETALDARARTSQKLASAAGAILDAQQMVKDMVRVADFVEKYRGASGFQSIYLKLLREDSTWAKQDALYQKIAFQPDPFQWSEKHKATVRALAKLLLGRLQRIQPEIDAMNRVVRKDHASDLAALQQMAKLGAPVISPLEFDIGGRRFKATLDTE